MARPGHPAALLTFTLALLAACTRPTDASPPDAQPATATAAVTTAVEAAPTTGPVSTVTPATIDAFPGATDAPPATGAPTVDLPIRPDACPPTGESIWERRPASDLEPPPLPRGWVVRSIGTSVLGRDITAFVHPAAAARRVVVVVGGIHGNEPVSPPSVRGLVDATISDDVEVWLVPELNPDGVAAGTRCNANGVDLNRNFAWGWRPDDGGPSPMSEPETQAITDLIDDLRPDVAVWVHQPYGYVSSVGASDDLFETAWSAGSGLPVRPDVTQHGGGESWTHFDAGRPSMLVEIDTWDATTRIVDAQRAAFEALLRTLG